MSMIQSTTMSDAKEVERQQHDSATVDNDAEAESTKTDEREEDEFRARNTRSYRVSNALRHEPDKSLCRHYISVILPHI
jgi:hypothetical protein